MTIIEDTAQKIGQHDNISNWCKKNGVTLRRQKLNVGDYQSPPRCAVDTKKGMQEVYSNIVHDHGRFREECIRAQDDGIKLYILVEDTQVRNIDEVHLWVNPQVKEWEHKKAFNEWLAAHGKPTKELSKPPVSSELLAGMMKAMTMKYGVEWFFCHPARTGEFIYRLLNMDE